jgi:hypothetical protein
MDQERRTVIQWMLRAPVAAAAAGALALRPAGAANQQPAPTPTPEELEATPLAKFLARQEEGLTSEERRRVRRDVTQLEQALADVRGYPLGNDIPPATCFRALKTARS